MNGIYSGFDSFLNAHEVEARSKNASSLSRASSDVLCCVCVVPLLFPLLHPRFYTTLHYDFSY